LVFLQPFANTEFAEKALANLALFWIEHNFETDGALEKLPLHLTLFLRSFFRDNHVPRRQFELMFVKVFLFVI
jgi:hypothetical protein